MNESLIAVFGGLILCLLGTIALLEGNLLGAICLLGLGLIIVGVVAGFINELFDMFATIFEGIFK
jgi:hypothetical protein